MPIYKIIKPGQIVTLGSTQYRFSDCFELSEEDAQSILGDVIEEASEEDALAFLEAQEPPQEPVTPIAPPEAPPEKESASPTKQRTRRES